MGSQNSAVQIDGKRKPGNGRKRQSRANVDVAWTVDRGVHVFALYSSPARPAREDAARPANATAAGTPKQNSDGPKTAADLVKLGGAKGI
jgi:hypothetical protein